MKLKKETINLLICKERLRGKHVMKIKIWLSSWQEIVYFNK